ncbi:F0F1 ATP synthase subunit delta [Amycolatopsis alkalitolerans]|uniref:ATP synthase subunit delta n=1 Tax=Amycolatopsis alkalitolerans TaxID=2547244 RepID=A0A5C4LUK2_9PSEU|nr:F0F1 ATP synthase subunit delta [Amycolatopsis alkalitolerans]TNC22094.1 F0F1 ATP synthase subunit delta [Amycolatopsis alkalitolerans]
MMQASSRESLAIVRERLDELTADVSVEALRQLGSELSAVVELLARERVLLRHLADPSAGEQARAGLVGRVFDGKVGATAVRVLREVAGQRWSRPRDLVDAVELLGRQAVLTATERENTLDETEDELFRFGRVLGSENALRSLLSDATVPAERRLTLLHGVLDRKVGRDTMDLLEQAVRAPRGQTLDVLITQLADLAAQRRQRTVAFVTASAPLTSAQEERLAQVLSRIYARTISVQVDVDPEVLGGLVVRVGDEVIDGSVASRLAYASRGLPS